MSKVANVIIKFAVRDFYGLEAVNSFFDQDENGFVSVGSEELPRGWYGGDKMLEVNIGIGAFNYFDVDGFKRHLEKIEWQRPEQVQLFIQDQHEDLFSVWTLKEARAT